MKYKDFCLKFDDYYPMIIAYNNISFNIALTDIQKAIYDKLYGKDSYKKVLINSIKQLIDNYINTTNTDNSQFPLRGSLY